MGVAAGFRTIHYQPVNTVDDDHLFGLPRAQGDEVAPCAPRAITVWAHIGASLAVRDADEKGRMLDTTADPQVGEVAAH